MDTWFQSIAAGHELPESARRGLLRDGFAILPGILPEGLADAYDRAVRDADPADVKIGSTTTRVNDFVNRGEIFDSLYVAAPILEACCSVIRQPFKLSTMLARTLNPNAQVDRIHVDYPGDSDGWPMLGFILMIDDFSNENGATCFVPGSQGMADPPLQPPVPACGPAGSIIVYNGSVWHGHGANQTDRPRRSIQGAYIRRTERAWADLPSRMRQETLDRISPLAKYLLAL